MNALSHVRATSTCVDLELEPGSDRKISLTVRSESGSQLSLPTATAWCPSPSSVSLEMENVQVGIEVEPRLLLTSCRYRTSGSLGSTATNNTDRATPTKAREAITDVNGSVVVLLLTWMRPSAVASVSARHWTNGSRARLTSASLWVSSLPFNLEINGSRRTSAPGRSLRRARRSETCLGRSTPYAPPPSVVSRENTRSMLAPAAASRGAIVDPQESCEATMMTEAGRSSWLPGSSPQVTCAARV